MIKYALVCPVEHEFEGWFGSSADYDDQSARGLVECPACGLKDVRKAIMAPAIQGTKKRSDAPPPAQVQTMMMEAIQKVRDHVEENFDYVGDAFATEARAIHEGKSENRGIYGEATPRDVAKLKEDGVPVAALPNLPKPPAKTEIN